MIETHSAMRNMIVYRLLSAKMLLKAAQHDKALNIKSAADEFHWAVDTRDYVVLNGKGLGPFKDEVESLISEVKRMI